MVSSVQSMNNLDLISLDLALSHHCFLSSWLVFLFHRGWVLVFWVGEWLIKKMPFVKHIYSTSKQISSAISPDQNTIAFKEVAIIRHPCVGEYAFRFITSSVVLQLLLEQGASVLAKDEDGAVPLHDACAGGYTQIVQLLLSRATTPQVLREMLDTLDEEADTPLHHAARGEHLDVVRLVLGLLAHGASPSKKNIFDKLTKSIMQ